MVRVAGHDPLTGSSGRTLGKRMLVMLTVLSVTFPSAVGMAQNAGPVAPEINPIEGAYLIPPPIADHAKGWWNTLSPEERARALFGMYPTGPEFVVARHLYDDLDPVIRNLVNEAAALIYGDGGFSSVGAWWESLDCRLMRVAAGDGVVADPGSAFCAHYPGSGAERILGEGALAHVNVVGMGLLGLENPGPYPAVAEQAEGWWNTLSPEERARALFGMYPTRSESVVARHLYDDLDPVIRYLVNEAAALIYGDGGFSSVGAWWESLDCRLMRVAAGDGVVADPGSAFCAHYPGSGAERILGEGALAHVNVVGMGLLGLENPGVYPEPGSEVSESGN